MLSKIAYRLFGRIKIDKVFMRFLATPRAVILAYHKVCPLSKTNIFTQDMVVEPEAFEQQISYLKKHYNIVSLEQLRGALEKITKEIDRMAVITFDDAYADNYVYAFQVLKKYRLPATIFVPTAFIESGRIFWWDRLAFLLEQAKKKYFCLRFRDKGYRFCLRRSASIQKTYRAISHLLKYSREREQTELLDLLSEILGVQDHKTLPQSLSWTQMQEMSREGINFGAHTHTHQPFSLLTDAQLQYELSMPRDLLGRRLGINVTDFAYPYGERPDFNISSFDAIAWAGYKIALTMIQGLVAIDDNIFLLPRIGLGGKDTEERFRLKLSGLIPLFRR